MGESHPINEQSSNNDSGSSKQPDPEKRRKLEELMTQVDSLMPSPSQRAVLIWNAIDKGDLSIWDLTCFCIETLGHVCELFPEFEPNVRALNLILYSTHYRGATTIMKWEQLPQNKLDTVTAEQISEKKS